MQRISATTARLAAAAAVVVGGLALPGAPPAAGDTQTCAYLRGVMYTGSPLYAPGVGGAVSTAFSISFSSGQCTVGGPPTSLSGVLSGFCDGATGLGRSAGGHDFNLMWGPGSIVFDGYTDGIIGGVQLTADSFSGHSCLSGASRFLIEFGTLHVFH